MNMIVNAIINPQIIGVSFIGIGGLSVLLLPHIILLGIIIIKGFHCPDKMVQQAF